MTAPIRIQRKRTPGWKMPPNTVSCTRPGRWGNIFTAWRDDDGQWTVSRGGCHWKPEQNTKASADKLAVEKYRAEVYPDGPQHFRGFNPPPTHGDIIKGLRGKNLACFCKEDAPFCHGNVLLELANRVKP